ncbi:MAG: class I SAM-dependent DNA methyltransferase [Chloroflexi bacterium]|nr:class I SAM-dependent DNA methyltransferase [Chloroflexota bacterium]
MTPQQFVKRWDKIQLKETAAAQPHFYDVCNLVGHELPHVVDPKGEFFTFEASTDKTTGGRGRADVWYRGRFIWEYKGTHADLEKAYQQLLLYRENLENPPLLITSDLQRIIIHTNFTGTVKQLHEITFDRLLNGDGLALLRRAFYEPDSFKPTQTQEKATQATADTFVQVVRTLQEWSKHHEDPAPPERLAHFVIRLFFCLFAEDLGLLTNKLFTTLIERQQANRKHFMDGLRTLFTTMRDGGFFGPDRIPHFDGGLFDDNFVPELPGDIIHHLLKSARQDWSAIDPTIFGTLFERVIDEDKRAQLGAHYTSRDDILLIVEPVLMKPLRDEWRELRNWCRQQPTNPDNRPAVFDRLAQFAHRIATIRVLDPACGSANFLYVSLRLLLDLQKEVITFAAAHGLGVINLSVSPAQLYGIEINPYAHELAQITVWIGYLQWRKENGFSDFTEPILRPLHNIEHKDAILAYDEQGRAVEATWPKADVILGNPPFLGMRRLGTSGFSHDYAHQIQRLYQGRVPGDADLVCYWFEKARTAIASNQAQRAGLLATNSIRGGSNRTVLERIKESGDIFMAWSDRPWILDGAAVRVSMIGFDNGFEKTYQLNGRSVTHINPDLTSQVDITIAKQLPENSDLAFLGFAKGGPFDIPESLAMKMMSANDNPNGRPNSDVLKRLKNGIDILRRSRNVWAIDFTRMTKESASAYLLPFQYVEEHVKPARITNREERTLSNWWLFRRPGTDMREAISGLGRYIVTVLVSKHMVFTFLDADSLPDGALGVIARDDYYFLGALHSRPHELWALRAGTWLGKGNDPRYTPTTTFETFPFPWPPGQEPAEADDPRVLAIAAAARQLDQFRTAWLNPPAEDIDTVIPSHIINNLTLTNLYNALTLYRESFKGKLRDRVRWAKETKGVISLEQIDELDHIHTTLDHAVLDAYGWPHTLTDEQILERLLALNLERAAASSR